MIRLLLTFFFIGITPVHGFYSCPWVEGKARNEDDYRSYYLCKNQCDTLTYCSASDEYFSRAVDGCAKTNLDWLPAYDINGVQTVKPQIQYRYMHQYLYDIYWLSETDTHQFVFRGRYINETHAKGTETILSLKNSCVLIADIELIVQKSRSICLKYEINRFSMKCKLLPEYHRSSCFEY